MLGVAAGELEVGGNGCCEFDQRMIEERNAAFQTVRHAHAIFDVKQRGQQAFEIEMGHFVEIGLVTDIVRVVEDVLERLKDAVLVEGVPIDLLSHIARTIDRA